MTGVFANKQSMIVNRINVLLSLEDECYPLYIDEALELMSGEPNPLEMNAIEKTCRENRERYASYADEIMELKTDYYEEFDSPLKYNPATNQYYI